MANVKDSKRGFNWEKLDESAARMKRFASDVEKQLGQGSRTAAKAKDIEERAKERSKRLKKLKEKNADKKPSKGKKKGKSVTPKKKPAKKIRSLAYENQKNPESLKQFAGGDDSSGDLKAREKKAKRKMKANLVKRAAEAASSKPGRTARNVAKAGARFAGPVGAGLGAIEAGKLAKEAIGDPFISDGTLMSKKITKRKDPETGRSVEELSIRPVSSRIKEPLSELEEASRRGRMASLGRGMAMKKGGKVPSWQDHVKSKYGK